MVVVVVGILVLIGGLIASRLLAGLFSLVALAAPGLWIGLNATHYNPADIRPRTCGQVRGSPSPEALLA
jgi:hypothetical protein